MDYDWRGQSALILIMNRDIISMTRSSQLRSLRLLLIRCVTAQRKLGAAGSLFAPHRVRNSGIVYAPHLCKAVSSVSAIALGVLVLARNNRVLIFPSPILFYLFVSFKIEKLGDVSVPNLDRFTVDLQREGRKPQQERQMLHHLI